MQLFIAPGQTTPKGPGAGALQITTHAAPPSKRNPAQPCPHAQAHPCNWTATRASQPLTIYLAPGNTFPCPSQTHCMRASICIPVRSYGQNHSSLSLRACTCAYVAFHGGTVKHRIQSAHMGHDLEASRMRHCIDIDTKPIPPHCTAHRITT